MGRRFCHNTHRYIYDASIEDGGDYPSANNKVVNSFNIEFGYELLSALPYAHWLYEKGLLEGTISGPDTGCLYYFSPKHTIDHSPRGWHNMPKAHRLVNSKIHKATLDPRFSPPPLKQRYHNRRFVYDKPIVCICNRVNVEWNRAIINYFDLDCLAKLFKALGDKYQIVYFNLRGQSKLYDGPEQVDIGDYQFVRAMGGLVIHDLHDQNPDLTFNELQLMVMANSEKFITMNGGYSILASYMGGTNLIYTKECRELQPHVNSFYRWYHKLGGSRILQVGTYEDLLAKVDDIFVQELPLLNVITRTCNRPNAFQHYYRSVANQTYRNINIIAGCHDDAADRYLVPYKVQPVRYPEFTGTIEPKTHTDYGLPFPSNHYMNQLMKEVREGWVMFLDDDDMFEKADSAMKIMSAITSEDDLILWRINVSGRIIPSDENFGNKPVARDISGIAVCCHSKHLQDYHSEPYRLWDYRLISHLYQKLNPVWINDVLTGLQGVPGYGKRKDRGGGAEASISSSVNQMLKSKAKGRLNVITK